MKDNKSSDYTFDKVSEWFDADSFKVFNQIVRSGDIVELRSTKCSHWGISIRVAQPPISPKSKSKQPKAVPDEIMVFHLIHSSTNRGQVGQFTLEEFWQPDCRIRINNTNNGANLYGNTRLIPTAAILQNAYMAHASTSLKWQTCADFIRWSSEDFCDDLRSNASSTSNNSNLGCIANTVSQ